jgi:hypothetical protein
MSVFTIPPNILPKNHAGSEKARCTIFFSFFIVHRGLILRGGQETLEEGKLC